MQTETFKNTFVTNNKSTLFSPIIIQTYIIMTYYLNSSQQSQDQNKELGP